MARLPKYLFGLAAIWSVIAGFIIFFAFGGTSITEIAETPIGGDPSAAQQTISHLSWVEAQGWWGVTVLFIFAILFYGVLHFYLRGKVAWTVVFGLAVITLSVLSGFTIGTMYWLGSLAVLLGLILATFHTLFFPKTLKYYRLVKRRPDEVK